MIDTRGGTRQSGRHDGWAVNSPAMNQNPVGPSTTARNQLQEEQC